MKLRMISKFALTSAALTALVLLMVPTQAVQAGPKGCSQSTFPVQKGGSYGKVIGEVKLPGNKSVSGSLNDTMCITYELDGKTRHGQWQCTYSDGWRHNQNLTGEKPSERHCSNGTYKAATYRPK